MKYPTGVVILSASEALKYLDVKPATLRDWARRGLISKVGYNEYDMAEILNYLERRAEKVA